MFTVGCAAGVAWTEFWVFVEGGSCLGEGERDGERDWEREGLGDGLVNLDFKSDGCAVEAWNLAGLVGSVGPEVGAEVGTDGRGFRFEGRG